jgi:hypothetical protein
VYNPAISRVTDEHQAFENRPRKISDIQSNHHIPEGLRQEILSHQLHDSPQHECCSEQQIFEELQRPGTDYQLYQYEGKAHRQQRKSRDCSGQSAVGSRFGGIVCQQSDASNKSQNHKRQREELQDSIYRARAQSSCSIEPRHEPRHQLRVYPMLVVVYHGNDTILLNIS